MENHLDLRVLSKPSVLDNRNSISITQYIENRVSTNKIKLGIILI